MILLLVVSVALAALVVALMLTTVSLQGRRHPREDAAARLNDLLPQTQCEQCTFPGCLPYAQAMARGDAPINLCPPGGQTTVDAIAHTLGQPSLAVVSQPPLPNPVAVIDEDRCIGCALCIKACPVDAILGASKRMHTVIESECTGCELCIAPCPVDCIDLASATRPRRAHVEHWQ